MCPSIYPVPEVNNILYHSVNNGVHKCDRNCSEPFLIWGVIFAVAGKQKRLSLCFGIEF